MKKIALCLVLSGLMVAADVWAQNGNLDLTFGSAGSQVVAFNGRAYTHDMAIQPDNKIIVTSSCQTLEVFAPFCSARINEDGTTDTTFKGGYPFASAFGVYTLFSPVNEGSSEGVVIQPDGRVIVVGSGPGSKVALIRYTAGGALDTSFGNGGISLTVAGKAEKAVLQPNGNIVIVASGPSGMFLARFLSDGTLDSTFGTGGTANVPLKGGSEGRSIVLQPDGKIIAGGLQAGTTAYILARFNTNGTPDTSWDGDGVKLMSNDPTGGQFDQFEGYGIRSVGVMQDGRVIALGHRNIIFSFNPDGSPDLTFDGDGLRNVFEGTDKETYSLTISSDGKITVVGTGIANQPSGPDPIPQPPFVFYTARLHSNGATDTSWGTDGIRTVPVTGLAGGAFAVASDPIGRIVVGGVGSGGLPNLPWQVPRFAVARFRGPDVPVSLSGRVTDTLGRGIKDATLVTVINGSKVLTRTNPLGYYTLDGVLVNQTYTINVSSKLHSFNARDVTINNQFATADFVAL